MKNESRRTFVKQFSIVSLGSLNALDVLADLIDFDKSKSPAIGADYFISYAFRLIRYQQMLELEFYFINASYLPAKGIQPLTGLPSNSSTYMVVRLPQQHIAEEYDSIDDLRNTGNDYTNLKNLRASAISGYSYLCFLIDFTRLKDGNLPVSAASFLDWNATHFSLVSKPDSNIQPFIIKPPFPFLNPELNEPYPLSFRKNSRNENVYNRAAYPNAADKYEKDRQLRNQSPFTAIELPYRLILSPRLPSMEYDAIWIFSGYKNECANTYELWTATLKLRKRVPVDNKQSVKNNEDDLTQGQGESPTGTTNYINKDENAIQLVLCGSPDYQGAMPKATPDIFNMLPTGDNRSDLVRLGLLNVYAKSPFITFTPLGASIRLAFLNKNYETNKINLYQWNQIISFGRDQHAEVISIVCESCYGFKMLHIKTTDREMYKKHGLLIYREFLMPLEKEKVLHTYKSDTGDNAYKDINYKYNTPFQKVAFATTEARQIFPVDKLSDDVALKDYAFWAMSPDRKFLEWPMVITDWMGNDKIVNQRLFILESTLSLTAEGKPPVGANFKITKAVEQRSNLLSRLNTIVEGEFITDNKILYSDTVGFFRDMPSFSVWERIQFLNDDLHLSVVDSFREKLNNVLSSAENKLIATATSGERDLEDFTRERWTVFKQKVFDGKITFEHILYSLQEKLSEIKAVLNCAAARLSASPFITRIRMLMTDTEGTITIVLQSLKQLRQDCATGISLDDLFNKYKTPIVALVNDRIKVFKDLLNDADKEYAKIISSTPEILAFLENKLGEIENTAVKKLAGYTYELNQFLRGLPADISIAAQGPLKAASDFYIHIGHVESTLKSRIEMAKAEICYTVYHAEDEFNEIKQKILSDASLDKAAIESKLKQYEESFHQAVNGGIATMKTDFIIFRRNLKKSEQELFNFFDQFSCYPQLHTAQVYMKAVTDLVHTDIPLKIKLAEQYYKNQLDDKILEVKNNAARIFAEVHGEAQELLKGAMREAGKELGGIMNPSLPTHFLTFLADNGTKANHVIDALKDEADQKLKDVANAAKGFENKVTDEFKEFYNSSKKTFQEFLEERNKLKAAFEENRQKLLTLTKEIEQSIKKEAAELKLGAEAFFKGLEANILGSIRLKDILGIDFNLPKIDRTNDKVSYQFITQNFKPFDVKVFKFIPRNTKLLFYAEKGLKNNSYYTKTRLTNFIISVFDERLIIKFQSFEITSNEKERNKISVALDKDAVMFGKELSFLGALQRGLQLPGTGLKISVSPVDISINYSLAIPGISGGAFTFDKLKFLIGISVPLPLGLGQKNEPVSISLGINNAEEQFAVGVLIFGGFGHFVLETTPKYIKRIDAGISFGGLFSINLGIASGQAFLQAGVRYVYNRTVLGETSMELYALLTCGATVTVFGFIEISVVFTMYLKYQQDSVRGAALYGVASVSCSVRIGFFSKSFTLTFSKKISGSGNPSPGLGYRSLNNDRLRAKDRALQENDYAEDLVKGETGEWATRKPINSLYNFAGYDNNGAQDTHSLKATARLRLRKIVNVYKY